MCSWPICATPERCPRRGEIIVFRPPGPDTVYVKRVIGLPGDRIALKAGRLVLNGKLVERRPKGRIELDLPLGPTPVVGLSRRR